MPYSSRTNMLFFPTTSCVVLPVFFFFICSFSLQVRHFCVADAIKSTREVFFFLVILRFSSFMFTQSTQFSCTYLAILCKLLARKWVWCVILTSSLPLLFIFISLLKHSFCGLQSLLTFSLFCCWHFILSLIVLFLLCYSFVILLRLVHCIAASPTARTSNDEVFNVG